MVEIFQAIKVSPKRAVLTHTTDLFGQTQANSFLKPHKELNPPSRSRDGSYSLP